MKRDGPDHKNAFFKRYGVYERVIMARVQSQTEPTRRMEYGMRSACLLLTVETALLECDELRLQLRQGK